MTKKYCFSKNIYVSCSSPKLLVPLFSIPFSPIWSNSREHMSSMFTNWEEFHLKINLLFNTILYFSIGLTTYVIYVNVSEDLQIVFIVSYFLCLISYFSNVKICFSLLFCFVRCYKFIIQKHNEDDEYDTLMHLKWYLLQQHNQLKLQTVSSTYLWYFRI